MLLLSNSVHLNKYKYFADTYEVFNRYSLNIFPQKNKPPTHLNLLLQSHKEHAINITRQHALCYILISSQFEILTGM